MTQADLIAHALSKHEGSPGQQLKALAQDLGCAWRSLYRWRDHPEQYKLPAVRRVQLERYVGKEPVR